MKGAHWMKALTLSGELDPTDIITHRLSLDQAEDAYSMFNDKKEGCIKVVLKP